MLHFHCVECGDEKKAFIVQGMEQACWTLSMHFHTPYNEMNLTKDKGFKYLTLPNF